MPIIARAFESMEHKKSNIYDGLFYLVLVVLISATLILGIPILGTFVADDLFAALGCSRPGFDKMPPCWVGGIDVSWRFTIYYIPVLGTIASPLAFVVGFFDFIILCVVLMIVFKLLSQRQNKAAGQP